MGFLQRSVFSSATSCLRLVFHAHGPVRELYSLSDTFRDVLSDIKCFSTSSFFFHFRDEGVVGSRLRSNCKQKRVTNAGSSKLRASS